MPGFQKRSERVVHRGPLITVAVGTFVAPDGTEFERDIVHHPGAVSVVPVIEQGDAVLLVRQYRAPIDRMLLEIPAGKRDVEGEPPVETARRELVEEIGMRAGRIEPLTEFYNSPGFCDELHYVFMALDLEPCPNDLQGIEEQNMTVERVSFDAVPELIASHAIVDAKTIIGLTLAQNRLAS